MLKRTPSDVASDFFMLGLADWKRLRDAIAERDQEWQVASGPMVRLNPPWQGCEGMGWTCDRCRNSGKPDAPAAFGKMATHTSIGGSCAYATFAVCHDCASEAGVFPAGALPADTAPELPEAPVPWHDIGSKKCNNCQGNDCGCPCHAETPEPPKVETCLGCNDVINQDAIDTGCRRITKDGVLWIRCAKSGTYFSTYQWQTVPKTERPAGNRCAGCGRITCGHSAVMRLHGFHWQNQPKVEQPDQRQWCRECHGLVIHCSHPESSKMQSMAKDGLEPAAESEPTPELPKVTYPNVRPGLTDTRVAATGYAPSIDFTPPEPPKVERVPLADLIDEAKDRQRAPKVERALAPGWRRLPPGYCGNCDSHHGLPISIAPYWEYRGNHFACEACAEAAGVFAVPTPAQVDESLDSLWGWSNCRHCHRPLYAQNLTIADGCPCNSGRGINHGLVPAYCCTCVDCDPDKTGGARPWNQATRPNPALDKALASWRGRPKEYKKHAINWLLAVAKFYGPFQDIANLLIAAGEGS